MQLPDTFHTKVKGVDTLKNNGRCSGRIVVATGVDTFENESRCSLYTLQTADLSGVDTLKN